MQVMNFQPLDFSGIRTHDQQAEEARKRKLQAQSGIWDAIGQGGASVVNAYGDWSAKQDELARQQEQQKLAEEWRQKQWGYQQGRDAVLDARYNEQLQRQLAEQEAQRKSAEQLRDEFMGKYGNTDLSRYGLGAQFAMSRIQNARDWNDVVSGGESLASIIQAKDLMDAQAQEQQKNLLDQKLAQLGPELNQSIRSELAASGMDLGRLNEVFYETPKSRRKAQLNNLISQRNRLVQYQTDHPGMMTPEMAKQLDDLNSAIRAWRKKMGAKPVSF